MTNIIEILNRIGVKTIDNDYRSHIDEWMDWYKGKVDKFHTYNVFNGVSMIKCERATLGMAKTVAEDWANLLMNERVKIAAEDERIQDMLDIVMKHNDFDVEANRTIEAAFASGTGAFTEWMDAEGHIRIDYHDARMIHPIAWCGHRITECAFSSVDVRDGKKYIYIRMYKWSERHTQVIINKWFDYESGNPVTAPAGIEEEVDTGMKVPLFQIIKPNINNNIDTTCPLGVSVFANALDSLMGVDVAFDSFRNEFILGRKRLMVPMSMVKMAQTREGQRAPMFDPSDTTYVAYEAGEDESSFTEFSPAIRATEHITGIRTQLNLLSFKCGLGTGRYEFDKSGGVKTATEVVSEQSDLYQSVCKHEIMLRQALSGLCSAILDMCGIDPETEVNITFDDSIIQDKASIRTEAREEVAQGLMSKYRYLTEFDGMGEEEANEEIERISKESRITSGVIDFFNTETGEA